MCSLSVVKSSDGYSDPLVAVDTPSVVGSVSVAVPVVDSNVRSPLISNLSVNSFCKFDDRPLPNVFRVTPSFSIYTFYIFSF
jgi:hypothetical protein